MRVLDLMRAAPIGLGTATFGREIDEDQVGRVLDYAVEQGITLLDTAESYGGGNSRERRKVRWDIDDEREVSGEFSSSERIIGRWRRARGIDAEVSICTKVSSGNSPANIARAIRDSSERLQTDCIDLFMLHTYDKAVPLDETLIALGEHVSRGEVAVIGCSNFTGDQLREATSICREQGLPPMDVIEPPYSLVRRTAETELFPICRDLSTFVLTYSPLGSGFLTGKYRNADATIEPGSRFDVLPEQSGLYFKEHNFRVLDRLCAMAAETDEPPAVLATRWAASHPDVDCVLIGARETEHIDNALRAVSRPMSPEDRHKLDVWP